MQMLLIKALLYSTRKWHNGARGVNWQQTTGKKHQRLDACAALAKALTSGVTFELRR